MEHKAYIFDRDGIIIDSEPVNLDSAIKAFAAQDIEITDQEKKIIIGTHPVDYKAYFEKKYPNFDFIKFRADKKDIYVKGLETAALNYKVIDFIKSLHQKNLPLALVTSGSRGSTELIMRRAGLDDVFKFSITFEDCEKRKPAPDCYLMAANKLNVLPAECLVFEDSGVGVEAAKSAGMTCYALPHKLTQSQDFSKADKVLDSINEALI